MVCWKGLSDGKRLSLGYRGWRRRVVDSDVRPPIDTALFSVVVETL